jgi:hypothetical protein
MNINVSNYKIILSMIDVMQLPDRKEIKQFMESYFGNLQLGMPSVTMAYKDLSPDAKVQMASKIGLQIQIPADADSQDVPISLLADNKPSVSGRVPLAVNQQQPGQTPQQPGQPQSQGDNLQQLMSLFQQSGVNLSMDELSKLSSNPMMQQMLQQGQQQPGPQQPGQLDPAMMKQIFDGLSHEEKLHLQSNPQLLQQFIQQMMAQQGGQQQ